jgi:glycine oxidase
VPARDAVGPCVVRELYTGPDADPLSAKPAPGPGDAAADTPVGRTYHWAMEGSIGSRGADVVVIGGGVIGLSIAWEAASAGKSVTVVDPSPGRGASWAAAGMLAPVGEANFGEDPLTALNIAGARSWPGFANRLEAAAERTVGYLAQGTLLVAVDASDLAVTDDLLDYRERLGLAADRLGASQCRATEPLLAPGVRGGAELVGDHQVDNRRLLAALVAAGRAGGVELREDEVCDVELGGGRAAGVTLRHGGRLPAGAVVVAAGCRSGRIGGIPAPLRPPVRPVGGVTVRLRAPDGAPVLRRTVRGLVHGRSCYLVPRADRSLVVGATVEERGFDLAVRAGAVGDLLDDARRLAPSLEEYEVVDTTAGLRPGSPDNAPIVGATGLPGLIVATGHYRNGILLAPITAAAVVAQLAGEAGGEDGPFASFGPDRFAGPAGPAPARAAARTAAAGRTAGP